MASREPILIPDPAAGITAVTLRGVSEGFWLPMMLKGLALRRRLLKEGVFEYEGLCP